MQDFKKSEAVSNPKVLCAYNAPLYYLCCNVAIYNSSQCDHMTYRFVTVSYQLFTLMAAVILTAEHVRAIDTVPQLNVTQYIGTWYQVCNMQHIGLADQTGFLVRVVLVLIMSCTKTGLVCKTSV